MDHVAAGFLDGTVGGRRDPGTLHHEADVFFSHAEVDCSGAAVPKQLDRHVDLGPALGGGDFVDRLASVFGLRLV